MSVNIQEQFQKLGLGEKIILIAGPLLFIDSFLPWYDVDLGPFGSISRSAWQSPGAIWSMLAVFIGIVMAGLVGAVKLGNVKLPELPDPVTWGRLHLGLGVAAVLFVLIKLFSESSFLGFGFYIGIIVVIALAAGGFLTFQEEQKSGGSTGADAGPAGGGDAGGSGGTDAGPSI
jgi:hypothetical protein